MHLLLRYTQALITQMAQTAVCNRHHSLDQQLCRWLLLSLDRLQGSELRDDAGADRQHARRAPRRRDRGGGRSCRQAGLIRTRAAASRCSTAPALEQRSCECYAVVKKEYDRLLPDEPSA